MKHIKSSPMTAYLAWFVAALFFYYQYILRASPGVMGIHLRSDFQMTAEQFSTLGAYYLYAYACLQIPLGLIVDRIGVLKTISVSILLCIAGVLLLATATQLWEVQLSRVLVGAGSAAAFMCPLKLAADYFSPGKRGFFMGATLMLGTFGALTAGVPLANFMQEHGWRSLLFTTIWGGLALLAFVLIFIPKKSKTDPIYTSFDCTLLWQDILGVLKNRSMMLYACLAIGLYTPLAALADLWGSAFIMQKYQISHSDAVNASMMLYVGLAMGSLLLPGLFERYGLLTRGIQICTIGLLLSFSFLLFGPALSPFFLKLNLALTGVFCGAEMMCFTGAIQHSSSKNSGITLGLVNTLNMLGGGLLQHTIGVILDSQWKGLCTTEGLPMHSTQEFIWALSILWIVILACCMLSWRLKVTSENIQISVK